MQADGNAVLYSTASGAALWNTRTNGHPGAAFALLDDGNLIVLAPDWRILWSSGTAGHPGSAFVVQDDGNSVLYAASGAPVWQSGTCCR